MRTSIMASGLLLAVALYLSGCRTAERQSSTDAQLVQHYRAALAEEDLLLVWYQQNNLTLLQQVGNDLSDIQLLVASKTPKSHPDLSPFYRTPEDRDAMEQVIREHKEAIRRLLAK